ASRWLFTIIDQFEALEGPKLLVLDEFVVVAKRCKQAGRQWVDRLDSFITDYTSIMDSEQAYLWLMTQQANLKDMGLTGGTLGNCRKVAIAKHDNLVALEAMARTSFLPQDAKNLSAIQKVTSKSEVKRAVFDSVIHAWVPMPALTNYAGYNRDTRRWEHEPEQTVEAQATKGAGIKPSSSLLSDLLADFAPNDPMVSLLRWLIKRAEQGEREFSFKQLKDGAVGKRLGQSREVLEPILNEAVALGILVETSENLFRIPDS
ncbi:MAG: hypothetical protein F6K19_51720, partial [Cyanothece sp. SIO1E1]|nr:hypothetical protein [Cyanothece sp. SIO1E1]